jgi:hypothetical protein
MRRIPGLLMAGLIGIMPIFSSNFTLSPSAAIPSTDLSSTSTPTGEPNPGNQNNSRVVSGENISANSGKTVFLPITINNNPTSRNPTASPLPTRTTVPAKTPTPSGGYSAPVTYYIADRVMDNSDFSILSAWGINTAIVDFDVNGSSSVWKSVFTEAAKYNIGIVIWPSDWAHPRPNCDWEAPFPVTANGDITKVQPLLDVASAYSNFIGIINGHESFWTCTNMTFDEMAGLKTKLMAYTHSKGHDIKVWNYINSLYWPSMLPDNQISRIMDVAVTWKHCAGSVEGPCDTGKDSALQQIIDDRARITKNGLTGVVDLVFIMQTFTTTGYTTKFTLSQLETYSCEFIKTNSLDGFGYYTWDAGWWPDLHSWTDLQPAIPYVESSASCR